MKMAGKADAMAAMSPPTEDSSTAMKIATPESTPRIAIIPSGTGALPLGASTCLQVTLAAAASWAKNASSPKATGFPMPREMAINTDAPRNHTASDSAHMARSEAEKEREDGRCGGAYRQATRNSEDASVPPGTVNKEA
jgi:hypothetical protein